MVVSPQQPPSLQQLQQQRYQAVEEVSVEALPLPTPGVDGEQLTNETSPTTPLEEEQDVILPDLSTLWVTARKQVPPFHSSRVKLAQERYSLPCAAG